MARMTFRLSSLSVQNFRSLTFAFNLTIGEPQTEVLRQSVPAHSQIAKSVQTHQSNLKPQFNFTTLVEGKSNQLGRAAALQIGGSPGTAYNPYLIYGASGLGKTHLMQAIGNEIVANKPDARVLYINSERYVAEMVSALQHGKMNDFKVLTCDRYPKEVNGLEERLKTRFGWGLSVAIEPPELEMRVAILNSKAEQNGITLPSEVSFFVAKRIRSNVRELEGALRRIIANSQLIGTPITLDFA